MHSRGKLRLRGLLRLAALHFPLITSAISLSLSLSPPPPPSLPLSFSDASVEQRIIVHPRTDSPQVSLSLSLSLPLSLSPSLPQAPEKSKVSSFTHEPTRHTTSNTPATCIDTDKYFPAERERARERDAHTHTHTHVAYE